MLLDHLGSVLMVAILGILCILYIYIYRCWCKWHVICGHVLFRMTKQYILYCCQVLLDYVIES
jgi:hypothetical protein